MTLSTTLRQGVAHCCPGRHSGVMSATPLLSAWIQTGYSMAVTTAATPRPTPHPTAPTAPKPAHAADVAAGISGGTVLLIVIGIAVIGYLISIATNPNTKCQRCKGRGFHRGSFYSYATRSCSACGGRGIKPRLGRRVLLSKKS
jgi:hypothetical protein